nr:4-hydroxy-3-methylbut-2-en-1-yl diphosphate synthase [uncultured Roseibium sp.]
MFITVLVRSLSVGLSNIGTFFGAGWAYILLLLALNSSFILIYAPENGFSTGTYMSAKVDGSRQAAFALFAMFANPIGGFSIAIAYVRRILIEANDFPVVFGKRTLKFIGLVIALTVIGFGLLIPLTFFASLVAVVTAGIGSVVMIVMLFVALMVVQRFSLVLPAAAVDDPLTLAESWHATAGLGWAMAFSAPLMSLLSGVLFFVLVVLVFLGSTIVPQGKTTDAFFAMLVVFGTMLILVWAFASLQATSYGLIRERFARKLGLLAEDFARADAQRQVARERAQKALAGARRVKRD